MSLQEQDDEVPQDDLSLQELIELEVSHKEVMLEQVEDDSPEQEREELPELHPQLDELDEQDEEELEPQLELSCLSLSE